MGLLDKIKDLFSNKQNKKEEVVVKNELGNFYLDKEHYYYTGNITIDDLKIYVLVNVNKEDIEGSSQFSTLIYIYPKLKSMISKAKEHLVKNSLKAINYGVTNQDDIVSEEKFLSELTNVSITIDIDNDFKLYFENLDCLGGHSIEILYDKRLNIKKDRMVG